MDAEGNTKQKHMSEVYQVGWEHPQVILQGTILLAFGGLLTPKLTSKLLLNFLPASPE